MICIYAVASFCSKLLDNPINSRTAVLVRLVMSAPLSHMRAFERHLPLLIDANLNFLHLQQLHLHTQARRLDAYTYRRPHSPVGRPDSSLTATWSLMFLFSPLHLHIHRIICFSMMTRTPEVKNVHLILLLNVAFFSFLLLFFLGCWFVTCSTHWSA